MEPVTSCKIPIFFFPAIIYLFDDNDTNEFPLTDTFNSLLRYNHKPLTAPIG